MKLFLWIVCIFGIISCNNDSRDAESIEKGNNVSDQLTSLTIGVISERVHEEVLVYQNLISYLKDNFKHEADLDFNVVVYRSPAELIDAARDGLVHLYFDSPYPAKVVSDSTNLKIVMKQWKAGVEYYRAVIFTRSDALITNLDDLKGRIIGFEKIYSTSGFILPFNSLKENGYQLTEADNLSSEIPSDNIGYFFTGDDENTVYWVLEGKLTAGATDNVSFRQFSGIRSEELKVIYETPIVPRHLALFSSELDEEIKIGLGKTLLQMHKSPEGQKALDSFYGTTKFDTLSKTDFEILQYFDR